MDKSAKKPTVYFCPRITADNLVNVYNHLGRQAKGRVAIKLSTGEAGNPNHLSVDVIKKLVHQLDGTIVECNTAYEGRRNNTADHLQTAREHGFAAIAEVDIMVPTYGFCEVPPCEEFAENVCDEFFSLPLFPQSSCAFEEVGGASCCGSNGATATAATGGSYACGCTSAGKSPTASTCSHCGTTCLSGQGSLCPRCGCTMTSVS